MSQRFVRGHRRQRTEPDVLAACQAPVITSPRQIPSRIATTAPSSPAFGGRHFVDAVAVDLAGGFGVCGLDTLRPSTEIIIPDPLDIANLKRRDYEKEDLASLPPPIPISRSSQYGQRLTSPALDPLYGSSYPPKRAPSPLSSPYVFTASTITDESFARGRRSMDSSRIGARRPVSYHHGDAPVITSAMARRAFSQGRSPSPGHRRSPAPSIGAVSTRTPSPLLPTIQHTDEDGEDEPAEEEDQNSGGITDKSASSSSTLHTRRRTRKRISSSDPPLIVTTSHSISSPSLRLEVATPNQDQPSPLAPLPTSQELMLKRGSNGLGNGLSSGRRRVITPTREVADTRSSTALMPPEPEVSGPRRNSFNWDRRQNSTSAFYAALEAREDRSSTPPRRLSAANLWNAATSSILGRFGLRPHRPGDPV